MNENFKTENSHKIGQKYYKFIKKKGTFQFYQNVFFICFKNITSTIHNLYFEIYKFATPKYFSFDLWCYIHRKKVSYGY